MPANLPPEYFEAERKFKEASTPVEKAEALEHLISTIPKHKGTDKLRADYRKKLSKIKSQAEQSKKTGKHESHFHIEKEGAGRIVVVGMPNVGKSSLLSALTHAKPDVSGYPYTTWLPTPGMVEYENIHLQLIDTPPLDKEYVEQELIELIKTADLILLMVDLQGNPIEQFEDAVEILEHYHIASPSKKLENIEQRIFRIPFIVAVNKDDVEGLDEDYEVLNDLLHDEWICIPISIKTGRNINQMLDFIIREMKLIRVYSKPPGHEADKTIPFILKKGSTVEEFAAKLHKDFLEHLKTARVWGQGVFDGQLVGRDHVLNDGDIVELHL